MSFPHTRLAGPNHHRAEKRNSETWPDTFSTLTRQSPPSAVPWQVPRLSYGPQANAAAVSIS